MFHEAVARHRESEWHIAPELTEADLVDDRHDFRRKQYLSALPFGDVLCVEEIALFPCGFGVAPYHREQQRLVVAVVEFDAEQQRVPRLHVERHHLFFVHDDFARSGDEVARE